MHESWPGKHREEIRLKLGKYVRIKWSYQTLRQKRRIPRAETACGSESAVTICVQPNPVKLKLAKKCWGLYMKGKILFPSSLERKLQQRYIHMTKLKGLG